MSNGDRDELVIDLPKLLISEVMRAEVVSICDAMDFEDLELLIAGSRLEERGDRVCDVFDRFEQNVSVMS